MAKKGTRLIINMACAVCKSQNYTTKKNRINDPEKMKLEKFCSQCRKITEHTEVKK